MGIEIKTPPAPQTVSPEVTITVGKSYGEQSFNNASLDERKRAVMLAAGAAIAAVFPPAAAVIGLAAFLGSARRYAQAGDTEDAVEMVLGIDDGTDTDFSG